MQTLEFHINIKLLLISIYMYQIKCTLLSETGSEQD